MFLMEDYHLIDNEYEYFLNHSLDEELRIMMVEFYFYHQLYNNYLDIQKEHFKLYHFLELSNN